MKNKLVQKSKTIFFYNIACDRSAEYASLKARERNEDGDGSKISTLECTLYLSAECYPSRQVLLIFYYCVKP